MLLSMIRYIRGYIHIRITGSSPERFLNACSHRSIYLWGLKSRNGAYEMYISLSGFRKLKPILRKTGTKVSILGRYGLPFFLHRYRKRKMFFAGAVLCLFLIYGMSLFIWNIDIEGNVSRTDETLLSYLKTEHVHHGMPKKEVDCEQIVRDIRKKYNDIIWVSASVEGSRLLIQVKENEDAPVKTNQAEETAKAADKQGEQAGWDIVADRDCTITSIVTRQGVPAVQAGTRVKKGDLLVSGRIEEKNDAQEITGYQYRKADADITGEYTISYENCIANTYPVKEYRMLGRQKEYQEEYFVRIGTWEIRFGLVRGYRQKEEYHTWEKEFRIGEDFILPVSFGKRAMFPYQSHQKDYTIEEQQKRLSAAFAGDCREFEKKGLEIIQNNVKIYREQNQASARGILTVQGAVGEERQSEVLEVPKKDDQTLERENADGND